jgi:hypothetical protein
VKRFPLEGEDKAFAGAFLADRFLVLKSISAGSYAT